MSELQVREKSGIQVSGNSDTVQNRLEIIRDGIRKNYLARLIEMDIAPVGELIPLEQDLIDNVRLYRIGEMVYQKGDLALDKFTTAFNTMSTYKTSVFLILDSDGKRTDLYLGVRNNETDDTLKRSTVTLGDTLKTAVIGHFPGAKITNENRQAIRVLSDKIESQHNISSVSVVGNSKTKNAEQTNDKFVQGLEKLIFAMQGRQYIGIIIAENSDPREVEEIRKNYQELYTKLSPLQKEQFTSSESDGTSRSKSFFEMDGKQKAAMLGGLAANMIGLGAGIALGGEGGAHTGAMIGGQIAAPFTSFINSLAPNEQISKTTGSSVSTTTENKAITDMLQLIDEEIKRTNEFDSFGMWHTAGYFLSDDMAAAEIAASNYRSLMNGENSGREVSAINCWRRNDQRYEQGYKDLSKYLSRFMHPKFVYGATLY